MTRGGSAGYLTINPTQNYVGQAISEAGDTFARVRAEKYQKEKDKVDADLALQEQRRRDFKDTEEFNEKYKFISTGTGLDASNRQSVENAKNAYTEAQDNYQKTGDKKYLAIADNAMNTVRNVNEMPNALNLLTQNWIKNEDSYNPTSLNSKKKIMEKMVAGNIVQTNDENGNARYTIIDKDDNGAVTKVLYKDLNQKQLMDLLTPRNKFDVAGDKGLIDRYQKSVGKEIEEEKYEGGKIIKTKKTPGSKEVAVALATETVANPDGLYDTLDKMGLDPEDEKNYTDEVKQKAVDYLTNTLIATTPEREVVEPDYKAKSQSLAERKEINDEKQRKLENARNARKDKLEQQKLEQENSTVVYEDEELTAQGLREKAAFEKKYPGVPMEKKYFTPGSIKTVRTTNKTKSNPTDKKETPKENTQTVPTYSIKDLKSNGWNDAQIKQAVKEGKIKTK